jgi:sec-independent protein translocase protein TatA
MPSLPLTLGFFQTIGPTELLVVAFVSLLVFGNRLPSVMRSLGKSVTEFKKGVAGIDDEIEEAAKVTGPKDATRPVE